MINICIFLYIFDQILKNLAPREMKCAFICGWREYIPNLQFDQELGAAQVARTIDEMTWVPETLQFDHELG
jgi:hypothetical protein